MLNFYYFILIWLNFSTFPLSSDFFKYHNKKTLSVAFVLTFLGIAFNLLTPPNLAVKVLLVYATVSAIYPGYETILLIYNSSKKLFSRIKGR